ncbi:FAD-dependent oxidoreductase [Jannaschia sp. S6380]|uniref:1-hydroxycarotenoid 3,4-desaturase CrtD n=1 Tax=Jannaschia sp. S6380 TaxID=2926408 RepID=UPI001FF5F4BB|nr:1-hydroxycarotenoid 3,4-desaturase CrtD [Jannaschia sp. S6380]MCK0167683.1 FAD-dependent oxidoreductase [Jannaschia sp. S6380]
MAEDYDVMVIGAGIGGIAAALCLAHHGRRVLVLERHGHPGGKIRTLDTPAGPVDSGPTVLTMRDVFEDLFTSVEERLSDHVELTRLPIIARHFWPDGTRLDLTDDAEQNVGHVAAAMGRPAARQFRAMARRASGLFVGFEGPVMQSPQPSITALTARVLRRPRLIRAMAPHRSLAGMLRNRLDDPRLAQLFGRYATYVGGMPDAAPAILALIYHAEASGVWTPKGGMQALPAAMAALARRKGAVFQYRTDAGAIRRSDDGGLIVETDRGPRTATTVIFNGDPRALTTGRHGPEVAGAVPRGATEPRSLSACVLSFSARARGVELSHHNVFFGDAPGAEFDDLAQARLPQDPTLYVCAQDANRPNAPGRFEIIMNAPAGLRERNDLACLDHILARLARFGLTFHPRPGPESLTMPRDFDRLFPHSLGALYGRAPQGLDATFRRPTARSRIPGLYLAGGGTHPGAGVPMATLSGRHAAAAILRDLPSTSTSRPAAMPGGMSTGSAMTAGAPSRSSAS